MESRQSLLLRMSGGILRAEGRWSFSKRDAGRSNKHPAGEKKKTSRGNKGRRFQNAFGGRDRNVRQSHKSPPLGETRHQGATMALKMAKKIWFDGRLINWQEATINVFSHSLQRGSAIFESIAFYRTERGPAVFRLGEHLDRLFESARLTDIVVKEKKEALVRAICKLIRTSRFEQGGIRPIAFLKEPSLLLMPESRRASLAIAIFETPKSSDVAKIKIASFRRCFSPISKAKTAANYALGRAAQIEAQKAGFDYTVFLDERGNLAEGPTTSIFIAKKGGLFTPPIKRVLEGITRDSVIKLARDLGYRVKEKELKKQELLGADEVFMAGTTAKVWPVVQIDAKIINQGRVGPMTKTLQDTFEEVVRGRDESYLNWLTFVCPERQP